MDFDKLTIDTPEQIAIEFPLAGIGSRFLAIAIDSIIQFVGTVVLSLTANFLEPDLQKYWPSAWNWTAALLILVFFTLYWGYYAAFETIWKGQTPGKRLAGIRVIKDDGRPVTAYEAVARNLVRIIDALFLYGVGVITIFLNKRNKRIGDFVAGTVVVHERKHDAGLFFNTRAQPRGATLDVSKLSNRELELIETFLARRLDLQPELRHATAEKLARRIAEKLGMQDESGADHEDFLENVAKELRDTMRFR